MNITFGTNNYNEAFKEIINFDKDYKFKHSNVVLEYIYLILDIKMII